MYLIYCTLEHSQQAFWTFVAYCLNSIWSGLVQGCTATNDNLFGIRPSPTERGLGQHDNILGHSTDRQDKPHTCTSTVNVLACQ